MGNARAEWEAKSKRFEGELYVAQKRAPEVYHLHAELLEERDVLYSAVEERDKLLHEARSELATLKKTRESLALHYARLERDADPHPSITTIASRCHETATKKGWWDKHHDPLTPTEIAAKIALVHSEVSEALEEVRRPEWPPPSESWISPSDDKPLGFPTELADVVIRVFDLAVHMGIDIEKEIVRKMAYNETRLHRHGGKKL